MGREIPEEAAGSSFVEDEARSAENTAGARAIERGSYEDLTARGNERLERAKTAVSTTVGKIGGWFQRTYGKIKGLGAESLKVVLSAPEIASYGAEKTAEAAAEDWNRTKDDFTRMGQAGMEAGRAAKNFAKEDLAQTGRDFARMGRAGVEAGAAVVGAGVEAGRAVKDAGVEAYRGTVSAISTKIEQGGVMLTGAKEAVMNKAREKYTALENRAFDAYAAFQMKMEAARERAREKAEAAKRKEVMARYVKTRAELASLESQLQSFGWSREAVAA